VSKSLPFLSRRAIHAADFGSIQCGIDRAVPRLFAGHMQVRAQALVHERVLRLGGMAGTLLEGASWGTLGRSLTFEDQPLFFFFSFSFFFFFLFFFLLSIFFFLFFFFFFFRTWTAP